MKIMIGYRVAKYLDPNKTTYRTAKTPNWCLICLVTLRPREKKFILYCTKDFSKIKNPNFTTLWNGEILRQGRQSVDKLILEKFIEVLFLFVFSFY